MKVAYTAVKQPTLTSTSCTSHKCTELHLQLLIRPHGLTLHLPQAQICILDPIKQSSNWYATSSVAYSNIQRKSTITRAKQCINCVHWEGQCRPDMRLRTDNHEPYQQLSLLQQQSWETVSVTALPAGVFDQTCYLIRNLCKRKLQTILIHAAAVACGREHAGLSLALPEKVRPNIWNPSISETLKHFSCFRYKLLTHKLGALLRGPNGTSHLRRPPLSFSFVSSLRDIWTFHFITNCLVFSCAKHGKKTDKGSGNKNEKPNRFGNESKKESNKKLVEKYRPWQAVLWYMTRHGRRTAKPS